MILNKNTQPFLSRQENKTTNSQRDLPKIVEQIRDDAISILDSLCKRPVKNT